MIMQQQATVQAETPRSQPFRSRVILAAITLLLLGALAAFTRTASAAAAIKIAAVGDSITWGAGASSQSTNSYPAQLQTLLGSSYQVGNYGHSGATMLKQGDTPYWNTPQYIGSQNFKPNVVVIMLGTNDSKPWNWQYKSAFISNYEEMIGVYRGLSSHPTVYINLPPPAWSNSYSIDGTVIQNEVIPMIRQVSSDTGAPIVDVNTPFLSSSSLFPDGVHPNDEGANQIARLVYNSVTGQPAPPPTPPVISGTAFDRSGWVASASSSSGSDLPSNTLDNNAGTRWSSGQAQANGQWFKVDMGQSRTFTGLTMDSATSYGDYAHGYKVYVSNDGSHWGSSIATASGIGYATCNNFLYVTFAAQSARYIKVVETDSANTWWSIHEFNVYD
jgi:lysophospholipase L1-like esterase